MLRWMPFMLIVIMLSFTNKPFILSVIMLNVVLLSVIMLNAVALYVIRRTDVWGNVMAPFIFCLLNFICFTQTNLPSKTKAIKLFCLILQFLSKLACLFITDISTLALLSSLRREPRI
jgi:hypothetical protein